MKSAFAKALQISVVTLVTTAILNTIHSHKLLHDQSAEIISANEFIFPEKVVSHVEKGHSNLKKDSKVKISEEAMAQKNGVENTVASRKVEESLAKVSEVSQRKETVSTKRNDGLKESKESISSTDRYDPKKYNEALKLVTKPLLNETTGGQFFRQGFWGGFVNQLHQYTAVVILAEEGKHKQILLESIRWRDNHGTRHHVRHEILFDVVHWNSFYPVLPRFVRHDPVLHSDVSVKDHLVGRGYISKPLIVWKEEHDAIENATNVFPLGLFDAQYSNRYGRYTRNIQEQKQEREDWDKAMTAGAFRPHPEMQKLVDRYLENRVEDDQDSVSSMKGNSSDYIMLHARIEPDMQEHPPCKDKKVTNFTDILTSIQEYFPEPPAKKLILALDRRLLERGIDDPNNTNELQKYNLKVLNEIIKSGLWGGRVEVMEAGITFVERSNHPIYTKYPSLVGSIVDFFLAQNAKMFIGTEVSSWSNAVARYRLYSNSMNNYVYRPEGVVRITPEGTKVSQVFLC